MLGRTSTCSAPAMSLRMGPSRTISARRSVFMRAETTEGTEAAVATEAAASSAVDTPAVVRLESLFCKDMYCMFSCLGLRVHQPALIL